jgi:hypothetical protein
MFSQLVSNVLGRICSLRRLHNHFGFKRCNIRFIFILGDCVIKMISGLMSFG